MIVTEVRGRCGMRRGVLVLDHVCANRELALVAVPSGDSASSRMGPCAPAFAAQNAHTQAWVAFMIPLRFQVARASEQVFRRFLGSDIFIIELPFHSRAFPRDRYLQVPMRQFPLPKVVVGTRTPSLADMRSRFRSIQRL